MGNTHLGGDIQVLTKPFSTDALVARVASLLGN
jgi:DNA-binding response OmpR family regulator